VTPERSVEGERVRLRAFVPDDAEFYRQIVNMPEVIRLADRHDHVGAVAHREWCQQMCMAEDVWFWAVEQSGGGFLGAVWLWYIRDKVAEIRIILGPPWGQGYGKEALRLLVGDAFAHGFDKLYAYVLEINPRAKTAFEAAGFEIEATLRAERILEGRPVDVWRLAIWRQ